MKRTKLIFLLSITVILTLLNEKLHAQNYDESVQIAAEAFKEGDFYTASLYYNNAMWYDSSDLKVAYQCAEAYRNFNNYDHARQWYRYVLNADAKGQFPLSRFWLAMMEKSLEDYALALKNFSMYYKANTAFENDYYTRKSKIEMEACTEAPAMMEQKKKVLIEHLVEGKINTPFSEFNGRQLSDTALVFSAMRPITDGDFDTYIPNAYISKIYLAKATVAGWAKTRELDARINDKQSHNANIAFSADYGKVFFTRSKSEDNRSLQSMIYSSENADGKWRKAEKLPEKINLPGYTTTQPFFVENDDHSILYFVSDRPGGFGKMDIWYSIFKDNAFQDPVNLGSIINTPGDDITPFYHKPTQTLYFSSDWHKGLGGYDIFFSKGEFNVWTKPENIGSPINSSSNDLYFTVNDVDNDGFFTSNRRGSLFIKSETCCNDIYSYEWLDTITKKQVVEVKTTDTVNIEKTAKQLLPITLYFHNDEPDPKSNGTTTKRNYQGLLNEYYSMQELYKTEYAKGLSGKSKQSAEKDIDDFFENYVAKGFANLKLFTSLLYADLSKGNSVHIKIKGYCSPLTTTEYNLNLAKRRIASITNFLKEYYEGVFVEYLKGTAANGARLMIDEEPLGESTANTLVSDNPNDKRNSIYSRAAAFERKIQIIMYESESASKQSLPELPQIIFADTVFDFGAVEQGQKLSRKFVFTNKGTGNLLISGVEPGCDCTTANWPTEPIAPGNSAAIDIMINADEDPGGYSLTATVLSNAGKGKVLLMFNLNIIPGQEEKK